MSKIALWCKTIAVIAIVSSLIMLILPESKSKKTFRGLISLIIIYVIINPFADSGPDFSLVYSFDEKNNTSKLKESFENYEKYPLIITAEDETEKYIDEILKKIGVDGEGEVRCDYVDENIIINEVVIRGNFSSENKRIIKDEIKKICTEETLIIFSGADNE